MSDRTRAYVSLLLQVATVILLGVLIIVLPGGANQGTASSTCWEPTYGEVRFAGENPTDCDQLIVDYLDAIKVALWCSAPGAKDTNLTDGHCDKILVSLPTEIAGR